MRRVAVAGGSMSPTLEIGDVVQVDDAVRTCKAGDVVLFAAPPGGLPLCHRVVLRIPAWPRALLVHRGDREGSLMAVAWESRVEGRAVARERAARTDPLPSREPDLRERAEAAALVARRALGRAARPVLAPWRKREQAELDRLAARRKAALKASIEVGEDYDKGAEGWEDRFAADPARVRRYEVMDRPLVDITRGANRVLDLGCGTGRLLAKLHGRFRVGIDVSKGMLKIAASRGHVVLRADAYRLPFADGAFDAITAGCATFMHLDYEPALAECARVLSPGGRVGVHLLSGVTRAFRPRSFFNRRVRGIPELRLSNTTEIREVVEKVGLAFGGARAVRWFGKARSFVPVPFALGPAVWSQCDLVLARVWSPYL